MTKEAEPTISHVLKAVQQLSTSVDGRFTETHEAILSLAEMTERRFNKIESVMVTKDYLKESLHKELAPIRSSMVTKDYLDIKLANLEGNLIVLTRKEDQKLHTLVDILHDKQVIDDADVRRVERLEPFAR